LIIVILVTIRGSDSDPTPLLNYLFYTGWNAVENDLIGYHMVLEKSAAAGNQKVVDKLKKNGPPPYTEDEKGKYTYLFQKIHVNSPNPPGSRTC